MTDALPYAIMCALKEIAGRYPSTDFRPIGTKRPDPEAMQFRRAYTPPLSPIPPATVHALAPPSKFEYSASTQDLVDFGLIKHGFWHDGDRQTTQYGFHLTEKAVEILKADAP